MPSTTRLLPNIHMKVNTMEFICLIPKQADLYMQNRLNVTVRSLSNSIYHIRASLRKPLERK